MTEIDVQQRSDKWFELRQSVQLTASKFGDAIGVGLGKPYHFLASILSDDAGNNDTDNSNCLTAHGISFEPVLNQAYQLLTGYITCDSGFWVPLETDALYTLVGASPDAKVYCSVQGTRTCIGLVEYKAPVYQMYREKETVPFCIPRMYMAQMQGQMAICGQPWCDFFAVCKSSREIQLKRVYFSTAYWDVVSADLKHFCHILQKAKERKQQYLDPFDFVDAVQLKAAPVRLQLMPEERLIKVQNLLECDTAGRYKSNAGEWLTFDFLIGNSRYDSRDDEEQ